jgi:hypothetical protein
MPASYDPSARTTNQPCVNKKARPFCLGGGGMPRMIDRHAVKQILMAGVSEGEVARHFECLSWPRLHWPCGDGGRVDPRRCARGSLLKIELIDVPDHPALSSTGLRSDGSELSFGWCSRARAPECSRSYPPSSSELSSTRWSVRIPKGIDNALSATLEAPCRARRRPRLGGGRARAPHKAA